MSKHTPGPWSVGDRPAGEWWHIYAGNQSICTAHACSKKHTPEYAAMFRENAVLIAAAPDLLDALSTLCFRIDLEGASPLDWPSYKTALKVIAKATGAPE